MKKKQFYIDINKIQPSQLYINKDKLKSISIEDMNRAIPLKKIENRLVMTDGHTRAVFLINNNSSTILAEWEEDDLDWNAYKICVNWCIQEKVLSPFDLINRIISNEEFNTKWIDRCQQMHNEI